MQVFKFAIRDDDTSYFTRPEQLMAGYSDIWDEAPVSLSVVPFHGRTRTKAIPREYHNGGPELFPIGDNSELTAFLHDHRARGRVSIMLHGYSHVDGPQGPEFETGSDLEFKVGKGKEYLEQLFETPVQAFVPPHNRLSWEGYQAVIGSGLDIVQIVHFRDGRRFTAHRLPPLVRVSWARFVWKQRYPYVLDLGTHREVAHRSLTPSVYLGRLLEELDFCCRRRGVFVVATHYWELNESTRDGLILRDALKRLIDRGRGLGARFCSVNEVLRGGPPIGNAPSHSGSVI